jgi:hypothetical protein
MALTRRTRYLIILLFFIASTSKGQEYYFFRTDPINYYGINGFDFLPKDLNLDFLDSLNKVYNDRGKSYYIIKSQNGYKLHVRCTFDVFLISENRIENLYKFDNNGYICNARLFEKNGRLYSLGGYGFWNYHQDLLVLDEDIGSWEFIPTINQPLNYKGSAAQLNSGSLVIFGSYFNPRTYLNEVEDHGWFLDWTTKKWNQIKIRIDGVNPSDFRKMDRSGHLELKDYYLFGTDVADISKSGLYFIDKLSLEIFFLQTVYADFFTSQYIQVIDNTLYFQNLGGVQQTLDIAALQKNASKVGHIEILKDTGGFFNLGKIPVLLLTIFFILILFFFLSKILKKKKPGKEPPHDVIEISVIKGIISKLESVSGQTLDIADLDKILGIHNIPNLDNRRVRRSRMVMDINTNYRFSKGKDLIRRVKKSDDKRYTYYTIEH